MTLFEPHDLEGNFTKLYVIHKFEIFMSKQQIGKYDDICFGVFDHLVELRCTLSKFVK